MIDPLRIRCGPALAICILGCVLSGCQHVRAPLLHDPHDPLPPSDVWVGADEDLASLQARVAEINDWALDAKIEMEKMDDLLAARNSELRETRTEHQRAVKDFREMHQTMEQWRGEIVEMQKRLAIQDRQRLLALEELNQQIQKMANP